MTSKIDNLPISALKPHVKNTRKHNALQIKELIRSLKKFGQIKPIVCDENYVVLAGHGLLNALTEMGAESAQVNILSGMNESDKLKLLMADNQIFNLGVDDYTMIESIISELKDFDIPGYDEDILKQIIQSTSDVESGFGKQELHPEKDSKTTITKNVKCPKCGHKFHV